MKTLFLNLPNQYQLTRRYMCSYNSPLSLFPPLELISLAAIVEGMGDQAILIDAIAEKINNNETFVKISTILPNLIVSIVGFESYQEDIEILNEIKFRFPEIKIAVIGHLPTTFYKETILHNGIDFIVLGEPDIRFKNFYTAFKTNTIDVSLRGVAFKIKSECVCDPDVSRLKNIEELPMPAHHLLPNDAYFEPLLPRPMGMIQSTRGCPYSCTYCVKSFGTSLSVKSPEDVVEEIKALIAVYGMKYLRFIDDTFTISSGRVIQICKLIIAANIKIKWSCLSRTDNIKLEMLAWMKKAGCVRIYFGIESGSQKILDHYKKKTNINQAYEALHMTANAGIETTGFFMMGFPEETWDDALSTIEFAATANLTHVGVEPIIPYPGTPLFEQVKDEVDFSLFPYLCQWKNPAIKEQYEKAEKLFYRKFYLRPSYLVKNFMQYATHPQTAIPIIGRFAGFLANKTENIMTGVYYKR